MKVEGTMVECEGYVGIGRGNGEFERFCGYRKEQCVSLRDKLVKKGKKRELNGCIDIGGTMKVRRVQKSENDTITQSKICLETGKKEKHK